jgi:hypothetical protein
MEATPSGDRPTAAAIAAGTWSGACSPPRSTRCATGKPERQATSIARRVLPTPPTPVTVTSRTEGRAHQPHQRGDVVVAAEQRRRRGRQHDLGRGRPRRPGRHPPGQALELGPVVGGEPERERESADRVAMGTARHAALQIADGAHAHLGLDGQFLLRQPTVEPALQQQVAERGRIRHIDIRGCSGRRGSGPPLAGALPRMLID